MASVTTRKTHSYACDKCCSNNTSLDESHASIRMNDTHLYETIPSPASITSTRSIEKSPKYQKGILSSTLKIKTKDNHSNMSLKRRIRYEKLFHHTRIINRQYMMTMTNTLFQMQKQLYKLKRRTHRVEQLVIKQTKTVQPIIRIPRLTKDQLSTICINNDENSIQETDINNNNEIKIIQTKSIKRLHKHKHSKNSMTLSKRRRRRHIWINNRQKPIDPNKYCSLCRYEYSKRSNFLLHVKNIHKGEFPPKLNEQDQSLLQMNEENFPPNKNEITNDQSVILTDADIQSSLQMMTDPSNTTEGRLRTRGGNVKLNRKNLTRIKVKCNICNKFYRADYLKKHKRRAHPDQEILSCTNENNNYSNEIDSISDKQLNENAISINELHIPVATTPTTITIADISIDDVPIRFCSDSIKSIVIAVTCLEGYQLELIEQFVEKFSSVVCQATAIDSRTTHLITNDEQNSLRSPLSMKLIEAIAHHCFCVSYRWIIDCLKYDRIIDEESYEIEGDDTEIHPHGGPRRSRLIPSRHSLFQDLCFMVKCTENSDIRMTNERLEDLITTCGGQIITCVTQRLLDKHQIIVLCDMLYVSERRHNYDQCRSLGIHFVSSDWVLESILEYRRKPFSLFEEVPL